MGTLKVQAHAADEGGCGHYRIIWPAAVVDDQYDDMEVEVVREGELSVMAEDRPGEPPRVVDCKVDADVLVLQRPLQRELAEAIPHIQRNGTAVVVELDDDFHAIHRQNTAWKSVQPSLSPARNWKHLLRACAAADLVTVTTTNLARKYGRSKGRVLPNYVNERTLAAEPLVHPRDSRPLRFTWTGSVATHPTDLQAAAAGFQQTVKQGVAECHVVGTGIGVAPRLGLGDDTATVNDDGDRTIIPNSLVHHTDTWVPIDQYPQHVEKHTDCGVVPLADIPFNRGKSWLKGLEFAAAGRPFVFTPTEPYLDLHYNYGLGAPANRPRDWVRQMQRMLNEPGWAEQQAADGLQRVNSELTYEQNAWRWHAVWAEAAAMRHR